MFLLKMVLAAVVRVWRSCHLSIRVTANDVQHMRLLLIRSSVVVVIINDRNRNSCAFRKGNGFSESQPATSRAS